MWKERRSGFGTTVLLGGAFLLLLALALLAVVPLFYCTPCDGGSYIFFSSGSGKRVCEYCGNSGKISLLKKWKIAQGARAR